MSGLVIFARPDPSCSGPAAREGPIPVELDSGAVVHDVIAELKKAGAVQGEVNVEWQGRRLSPSDALADVGLCPQSTVLVVSALPPVAPPHRVGAGAVHSVALLQGAVTSWGGIWGQADVVLPSRGVEVSCGEEHTVCRGVVWGGAHCVS
eukprot:Hpha_TRINITY_DN14473_c0_g1::TRINITY_DN14473_c0_g1_i1::g.157247::m.157247